MTISDQILEQTNQGLTKEQIRKNLVQSGHDAQQIDTSLNAIFVDYPVEESQTQNDEPISMKAILMGLLFIVVAVVRLARYSSSGGSNIFMLLGVITAVALAFFYFTKRG